MISNKSLKYLKSILLLILMLSVNSIHSQSKITNFTLSSSTAQTCDSIVVTIYGEHFCPNDSIVGISHSVSGSDITITLSINFGFCIPPSTYPNFVKTYTLPLGSASPGSYTVKGIYQTTLATTTKSLSVTSCCPAKPNAGADTAFCNNSTFQLNGNTPTIGTTASWSVVTGSGTINSSTQPNATISNLSYGLNRVAWTIIDTAFSCTVGDTIEITNDEMPTAAVTEVDRVACADTTTIKATIPTAGAGRWSSLTSGNFLLAPNQAHCKVIMSSPGKKIFAWEITNGTCGSTYDTLEIDYILYADTPMISYQGNLLTSTTAPSYQWYLDGNPISGATSKTYKPLANGTYKVLASELDCSTGLFSNEIDVLTVGISGNAIEGDITFFPNPNNGEFLIESSKPGLYDIMDAEGRTIQRHKMLEGQNQVQTKLTPGLYFIRFNTGDEVVVKKLLVN